MPHVVARHHSRPPVLVVSTSLSRPRSWLPALMASAAVLSLGVGTAAAQVTTNFTLDSSNSEIEEFSNNFFQLSASNFKKFYAGEEDFESSDQYTYSYATQFFTPEISGNYIFGQTEAPVDTVMIVYKGSFDPDNPGENFLAYNDDKSSPDTAGSTWDGVVPDGITVISCNEPTVNPNRCPIVGADLEEGQQYHVVISTYSSGNDLSLPLRFFVYGPGGVLVGEIPEDEVVELLKEQFEPTVTDRPAQPAGKFLDDIFLALQDSDPDGELFQALLEQAGLSESQRRDFVESLSSNVGMTGTRSAVLQTSRSTLSTVAKRFTGAGLGGAGTGGTTTATFAGDTVQLAFAELGSAGAAPVFQDARVGGSRSVGFDGQDTGDLAQLASTMGLQGGSMPGSASAWIEGYTSQGSGQSFDYRVYGGLVGADYRINENLLAGVFFGVGRGEVDGDDVANADLTSDTMTTGAYAALSQGALTLNASALASFGRNEHKRTVAAATPVVVEGSNRSQEITVSGGGSYAFSLTDAWQIAPTAQISHSWIEQTSYTETGNTPFTLAYDSQNQRVLRTSLGVDTGIRLTEEDGVSFNLFGGAAWGMTQHSGGSTTVTLSTDPTGGSFTLTPDTGTRHSADINAGFAWEQQLQANRSIAIRATYEGSFAEEETAHTGRLALAYHW